VLKRFGVVFVWEVEVSMNPALRVLTDNPSSIPSGSELDREDWQMRGTYEALQVPPTYGGGWLRPARLPRLRWVVQTAFALLTLEVGWQFLAFYRATMVGGVVTTARPAGVEAFLPIAALMSLERFVLTGLWDPVHPAGLTFLVAVLLGALVARRAFCSWVCPFGTLSRGLEWLRAHVFALPPRWNVPRPLGLVALAPKYLLLALFVGMVVRMSVSDIELFVNMPFNRGADAAMLLMLLELGATGAAVLSSLVLLSVAVRHAWCRFLCPYGALLGLAGLASPFRIRRDPEVCTSCHACTRACPSGIRVSAARRVDTPECTVCLSCVAACTTPGALALTTLRGGRLERPWLVPSMALGVLALSYALAQLTGHWQTSLGVSELREAYQLGAGLR
jgi:ferredoxin